MWKNEAEADASTTPEYPWGSDDAIPLGCCCYSSEPGSRKGPSDLAGPWRGASASQELKHGLWSVCGSAEWSQNFNMESPGPTTFCFLVDSEDGKATGLHHLSSPRTQAPGQRLLRALLLK